MTVAKKKNEAAEGEEGEKKGKKGLIIKIVLLLVVALVVAKMTVLKPPPPTPAQAKAAKELKEYNLELKCALANGTALPKPPKDGPKTTTTTTAPGTTPDPVVGPVLDLDSKTLNLAGGHFLKIGLSVQLPVGSVPDDIKTKENWGAITGQAVLDTFSGAAMDDIIPSARHDVLRAQIGDEVCLKSEGLATTVYFTEFVAQ